MQWLRDTVLLGVDLTLDDGTPYPDVIYQQALKHAVALAETTFDIKIDPVSVLRERCDLIDNDRTAWYNFRLNHKPINEVTAAGMRFGNGNLVAMPLEWITVSERTYGQINIIPASPSGDFSSFFFRSGMPMLTLALSDMIPQLFEFTYTAGFEHYRGLVTAPANGSPATVPIPKQQQTTDYDIQLRIKDFAPAATAWGATTFTARLGVAPPGPLTYRWVSRKLGQSGMVTFNGTDPVTVTLQRRTADTSYGVDFVPPDFGAVLTERGHDSFSFKLENPPAWDVPMQWVVSQIPYDLKQWIGLKASTLILDVAGDLIGGVGIASASTSMDGVSESYNTTSSPENSGFSARMKEFEKQMPLLTSMLKAKFRIPKWMAV
uniref:Uncharacterized protein n=1 Tax=uncultured Caudovirales phage TaxID=2100421 RepID=A0A6J5L1K1_9CAUD|nr:hypothetical protein UFOVP114_55 [uncultured Caudovirales phage]